MVAAFSTFGAIKKFTTTFPKGSPVVLRGKVSWKEGGHQCLFL